MSTPVSTHGCSFSVQSTVLIGAHTEAFQFASDASDDDADNGTDVYIVAPDDASSPPTSAANPDDAAQSPSADAAELCEVCLHVPRSGVDLVPCGHSRFCGKSLNKIICIAH